MAQHRKNVLLIITDQQRASEIFDEEGEGGLDLPAMQRLREYGTKFNNTICNTCMCSPSRSTLFTGKYPAQHGVTQTLSYDGKYAVGQHSLDNNLPNMGSIFAKAGYDCQYRGKWHLSKAENRPFDPDAVTPEDVAAFGFQGWIPPDAGEDAKPEHFGGGDADYDAGYVQQAIEWLSERKASDTDQPFLMVLSLVNPHDVLGYPNSMDKGYEDPSWIEGDLTLPQTVGENLARNNKPSAQAQLLVTAGASLGYLPSDQDKLNYLNFYGNLCEYVDGQINSVLDLFFDGDTPNDFFNDTLIVRCADHGEMGMSHGGMRQKAFNVYEETLRVPMVWSNPDWFGNGQETDALMSLVDVLPTLVGKVLGADEVPQGVKSGFAGVDMSAVFEDPTAQPQDALLFTFDDIRASSAKQEEVVKAPDRIRAVRTAEWKYAEYFSAESSYKPEYELYNLAEDDPNGLEYTNHYYAADGSFNTSDGIPAKVAEMRKALEQLMEDKLYLR